MGSIGEWLFAAAGRPLSELMLGGNPWLPLRVSADAANGLSCLAISAVLLIVVRKRPDLVCTPVLWMFAGFAFLSGASYWLDLGTDWTTVDKMRAIVDGTVATTFLLTAAAL